MKKKLLIFLAIIVSQIHYAFSQAPNFQWGFGSGAMVNSIVTDQAQNIYVTGSFALTVDFDPTANSNNLTSSGQSDIFVAKYSPNGDLIWVKSIGSIDFDKGVSIKLHNNEIVIGGVYNLTVDFDPGLQTANKTSYGNREIFILKMSTDGNFIGVESFGGTNFDDLYEMTVDNSGSIAFTGHFTGSAYFDPNQGSPNLGASGRGIFVCKLGSNLSYQWAKQVSGTGTYGGAYDLGRSITISPNGTVSVIGDFAESLDFNPGVGTNTLTAIPAFNGQSIPVSMFYLQLDANGNYLNSHVTAGNASKIISDLAGNLFQTGIFNNASTDFNPGVATYNLSISTPLSGYLRKFNTDGSFAWALNVGANNGDQKNLAQDSNGNIYISSSFEGTVDLDPTTGIANFTSTPQSTAFITKLTSNGNWQWSLTYGNITTGITSNTSVLSIHVDGNFGIISAGDWGANGTSIDLNPGVGTQLFTCSANFNRFLSKLQQCSNTVSNIETSVCASYTAPNGQVYTQSGSYSATIPNALGCDSVITINLTVNQPTSSTISPSICYSYTAPDGQVYTQSGNYTATIPNASGCDSIITINLTIHQNTTSSITPTSCSSYVAPDGQIYTQSGTYNATIPNTFGCDSLITINLTIQNVDTGVSLNVNTLTANSTGAQYQWIDCATNQPVVGATQQSFIPTYNGNFSVIVTNGNCSDTSSCTSVSHVSLDEMTSSNFSVLPNPTNGIVTISGLKSSTQNRVVLYTISGEKMAELVTTESEIELNLEVYAPGMYFLHVQDQVIRIVKN
jgi:hypothetical protein